jgi:hypothetical protein
MIAALIAPIEMPATQVGRTPASSSAWYTPAWYAPSAPPPCRHSAMRSYFAASSAGVALIDPC